MIELRREFLESNHSRIVETLHALRALKNLDPGQQHHAFNAMERLKSMGFQTNEIIELWSEIAEHLKQSDYNGRTLTVNERTQLLHTVEELRLRVISVVVIGMRQSDGASTQTSEVDWFNLKDAAPAIQHHSGNLVSALFKSHVVILLPEIENSMREQAAATGLLEIFERSPNQTTWIVDFSAMRQITHLLLGIIYGYRENLNRKGGKLGVCWLKHGIVPDSLMDSLISRLDLIRIGDHWFSRSFNNS